MFKIGEFSKISQVSMRMLRHYDEIGLFKPDHIDEATGYRYYSARRLPELNRIVALRMLDFSLEEIRMLLLDDLSANDIRALFKAKRVKLEAQIEQEQQRLRLLETRIQHMTEDNADAVLKTIPAQTILSIREKAPDFAAMDRLIQQTQDAASRQSSLRHSLAIFYDADFETQNVDWELGFVIQDKTPKSLRLEDGRMMQQRQLPAIELAACTMYEGAYFGLHEGYSSLGRWVEVNDYQITGIGREIFWHMDLEQPEKNVTELQFPVKKA